MRFDDHLYLRTWHDGYHPQAELAATAHAVSILADWTAIRLDRTAREDPMDVVRREGGPYHVRQHLPAHLERLRATGRGSWADVLEARHPEELHQNR